jgi:hypothetical protein
MEWKAVFYNGLETNIEVTKCGKVRRVEVDWYGFSKMCNNAVYGEVDFSKLKLHPKGYKILTIQIKGIGMKPFEIHRLIAAAFLNYTFGNKKTFVVDHIDNNKLNNNLDNLQIITHRENTSKDRYLKSGLPVGVCFDKSRNKYISGIRINGIRKFLGRFNTIKEASDAYQIKLKSLN